MSDDDKKFGRRAFLKGAGSVLLSLPFLEFASGGVREAAASSDAPRRLLTFFYPNGAPRPLWDPGTTGANIELRGMLAPLAGLEDKLAIVSGFHDKAAVMQDAAGDPHSRGAGAFCVGAPNPKQESDIFDEAGKRYAQSAGGPSIDQYAAQMLQPGTYLRSLAVGVRAEPVHTRTYHVKSWKGVNRPVPPIINPLNTFRRLFGEAEPLSDEPAEREERYERSVLDTVIPEYHRVTSERYGMSPTSKAKLADHLDAIRDLERRTLLADRERQATCLGVEAPKDYERVSYSQYDEVFKLQAELVAMALRCDITRFVSMMCACGAEYYKLPGVSQANHSLAHAWQSEPDNEFVDYQSYWMQQARYLLDELDDPSYPDSDGRSILDNTLVVIGTELGNPSIHSHEDMMYLLAGGADRVRTNYHHVAGDGENRAPNDLYTACLNVMGVETTTFGAPEACTEPVNLG
ncbi:MAG: DUF1552 domain-containing protein [Myxococcota bacterium]